MAAQLPALQRLPTIRCVGLMLAYLCVPILLNLCGYSKTWSAMSALQKEAANFNADYPLIIPDTAQELEKDTFVEVSMSAVRWHHAMRNLHRRVHHVGHFTDVHDSSSMEFDFTGVAASETCKGDVRCLWKGECRAIALILAFVMAAILYFKDSLHVAILLSITITSLLLVALRLKSLDDLLVASVAHLKHAESSLALMVHGSTDPATVGQHILAMLKLDAITEQWEMTRIGINVQIPFMPFFTFTVSPNFMISVFAAVYVRSRHHPGAERGKSGSRIHAAAPAMSSCSGPI
ncbi:hypothetical protein WJX84_006800 [Apatococcus fuscideae]|uniref:Uncharacterized protein n=1 Tax=Apatococcus fuscideae TaxID=2026836 RepID=A0AAW1RNA5_9CHLO